MCALQYAAQIEQQSHTDLNASQKEEQNEKIASIIALIDVHMAAY